VLLLYYFVKIKNFLATFNKQKLIIIGNSMKSHSRYVCQNCGATSARWVGKCSICGAWETYVEEIIGSGSTKTKGKSHSSNAVMKLADIAGSGNVRIMTGIAELDRVLGGGITPGSLILVGGDPGIGKSTLMLQLCAGLQKHNPLYITGEESLFQIKQRAARLASIPNDLLLLAETNISTMLQAIKDTQATIAIIDSIQTTYHEEINSTPGTVTQVRECTALLMQTAKKSGTAIFLVGHVTKDGMIADLKYLSTWLIRCFNSKEKKHMPIVY
jgi:DNA repair protein RadA/Sms